jgi:hypothetical protein
MTTNEQQAIAIFLTLVAATVHGLRQEYAKLIRSRMGPRDNGYTAAHVEPFDDYLAEQFYGYWRRAKIRASRLQALHAGG